MHRCNLDYSELCLDPKVMDGIDKTFAPLLGAEWTYIRPGINGCFRYEQGRMEEALVFNSQARALLTEESKIEGRICLVMLQHSIFWQQDKRAQAEEAMDELRALVESSAQFFLPNLKAYQAKLRLLDGEAAAAQEWLDEYFVVEIEHVEFFRAYQHFVTARAYLAQGNSAEAERYLQLLRDFGKNLNRPLDESEAEVLLAALHWAAGMKKQAAEELETALKRLQPYSYIRVVADEGAAVLPILKRISAKVTRDDYKGPLQRAYVNEVMLAAHSFAKLHKGYMPLLSNTSDKPPKLSKQQARVLTLLSQGYRNAEICELTGLKLPTVKTHTSLAYQKLGVNNAMDAVLKARELELIK